MRADFFGPQGDTSWRLKQLLGTVKGFTHHSFDIRNRAGDHIWYISNMSKFRLHYPGWSLTRRVSDMIDGMVRLETVATAQL